MKSTKTLSIAKGNKASEGLMKPAISPTFIKYTAPSNLKSYNLLAPENIASTLEFLDAASIEYLYNHTSNNELLFSYMIHHTQNQKAMEALRAILASHSTPDLSKSKITNELLKEVRDPKNVEALWHRLLTPHTPESERLKIVAKFCQNIDDPQIIGTLRSALLDPNSSEQIKSAITLGLTKFDDSPKALKTLNIIVTKPKNPAQIKAKIAKALLAPEKILKTTNSLNIDKSAPSSLVADADHGKRAEAMKFPGSEAKQPKNQLPSNQTKSQGKVLSAITSKDSPLSDGTINMPHLKAQRLAESLSAPEKKPAAPKLVESVAVIKSNISKAVEHALTSKTKPAAKPLSHSHPHKR